MTEENELFGSDYEKQEYGSFGNEHRQQWEAQQEALRQSAVKPSVCEHEFVAKEYSSQPYGTCLNCQQTVFSQSVA